MHSPPERAVFSVDGGPHTGPDGARNPCFPAEALDFRAIVEKSLSLVLVTDHTGRIQYVNSTFCETTGYAEEEIVGHPIHEFGQLDPGTLVDLWNTLGFGLPWRGEIAAPKKNGALLWLYSSVSPVTDPSGRVTNFLALNLDITERKRAEEALRESESRFRGLSETTTAATFIFDGSRIRYANSAAAMITGYSVEELQGKNFWEIAHPDVETATKRRQEARARGEPLPPPAEIRIFARDGTVRWLHYSSGFLELDGKELVLGTAFDITDRKLAEEALRDSEEKFRAIVETSNEVVWAVDAEARVTYANPVVARILGYTPEELLGRNYLDLLHPDDREATAAWLPKAIEEKQSWPALTGRWLCKDGSWRHMETGGVAILDADGNLTGFRGVARDATDRVQAEQAHRLSEERYRILYQDNPSMYFTLSDDLSVLSVNQHGAEQLGYAPEELVGEPVFGVVYPQDQPTVRRQLRALLRGEANTLRLEFRKLRKDGEVIWVKENVRASHDPDGRRIVLVVCEDITDRRRMEETLQSLREDLERKAERAMKGENLYNLSFRELTVLQLVVAGRSDKEISTVLGIRPLTVSKHVANILKKMGAASRTEASVRALREGITDQPHQDHYL